MAKPICLIKLPTSVKKELALNMMDDLTAKLNDYHVLTFINEKIETLEIQCFYDKDFIPIEYEQLKAMIEKNLNEKVETEKLSDKE
jgi:hypothetical protein